MISGNDLSAIDSINIYQYHTYQWTVLKICHLHSIDFYKSLPIKNFKNLLKRYCTQVISPIVQHQKMINAPYHNISNHETCLKIHAIDKVVYCIVLNNLQKSTTRFLYFGPDIRLLFRRFGNLFLQKTVRHTVGEI